MAFSEKRWHRGALFLLLSTSCGLLPQGQAATPHETIRSASVASSPRININTASAEQLDEGLHGVGARKAAAIVAYRRQQGPFRSVVDLTQVKGIGPALLEKNLDRITIQ